MNGGSTANLMRSGKLKVSIDGLLQHLNSVKGGAMMPNRGIYGQGSASKKIY